MQKRWLAKEIPGSDRHGKSWKHFSLARSRASRTGPQKPTIIIEMQASKSPEGRIERRNRFKRALNLKVGWGRRGQRKCTHPRLSVSVLLSDMKRVGWLLDGDTEEIDDLANYPYRIDTEQLDFVVTWYSVGLSLFVSCHDTSVRITL